MRAKTPYHDKTSHLSPRYAVRAVIGFDHSARHLNHLAPLGFDIALMMIIEIVKNSRSTRHPDTEPG